MMPWNLEETGFGGGNSEGNINTSCFPKSCSADSSAFLLWSHCHGDDMHQPLGAGFRVSLIGQGAESGTRVMEGEFI